MKIRLNVPYYSQLDNSEYTNLGNYIAAGSSQCNPTSVTMALVYLYPNFLKESQEQKYKEPESYLNSKLINYGYVTDHNAITECLRNEFNINSEWRNNLTKQNVIAQLDKNIPVPIGMKYKSSGHICCLVGYDSESNTFELHDPYGVRYGSEDYYDIGANGAYDKYSMKLMNQVFWDLGSNAGHGRLFYK